MPALANSTKTKHTTEIESWARTWRGYVFIATSVDGYIARRDSDIDWLPGPADTDPSDAASFGDDGPKDYAALMNSVDHLVMGRGTYEKVLTFDSWPYSSVRVIVLSTTLPVDGDDRISITRSIEETTTLLATNGARGVYVDGGVTIQGFLCHDLIDELTITRVPVLLGDGLPLFGAHSADIHLIHRGTISTSNGMTTTLYQVTR